MLRVILWWTAALAGVLVWLPLARGATQGDAYRWALAPGIGGRGMGGDYWMLLIAAVFVGANAVRAHSRCLCDRIVRHRSRAVPLWRD